jgi:hypothetical protein
MNKQIKTILPLAALAGLAVSANAAVTSIDFDSGNGVQSGEPTHTQGMTLPGQVGPWYTLTNPGSGNTASVTMGDVTFRMNTNEVANSWYKHTSNVLREDFFYLNDGQGPANWELTGLTPNGIYDIICYGRYDPNYGGYRGGGMSVNGGTVQTKDNGKDTDTTINEGDWNFANVQADGAGKIYGSLSHIDDGFAEFGGIQFELVPEPSTTALLGLGGLALILRRRK